MDYKGMVDFAIITIRDDEYKAVLQRFPGVEIYAGEHRTYAIVRLPIYGEQHYVIALASSIEQGPNHGQDLARDMIEDLDPQWLVVVGIAGAFPDTEYTLGDVIIARRLRDFSVMALIDNEMTQIVDQGGPMAKAAQDLIALLPAMEEKLSGWNSEASITMARPHLTIGARGSLYGNPTWRNKVKKTLTVHFGEQASARPPIVTARTIVSSGILLKDSVTAHHWLNQAKDISAVEMELAGVYFAARRREREYPILAIRGISDIVGLKRDPAWTAYACHSAAAFLYAFLQTEPIPPRSAISTTNDTVSEAPNKFTLTVQGDAQGVVQGDNNRASFNFGNRSSKE